MEEKRSGGGNKAVGTIKETIGKITGNKKLEEEGRAEKKGESSPSQEHAADRHVEDREDHTKQKDNPPSEDHANRGDNGQNKP